MCRMLIASGNFNLKELFDGIIIMAQDQNKLHEFNKEKGLGSFQHSDGWGIAYLDKNDQWILEKSISPIYDDIKINNFKDIDTKLTIIHARRGTKGEKTFNNTHPFNNEDHIFCHNGHVQNLIKLPLQFEPEGDTDSERLFNSIISNFNDKKNNFTQAIAKTLRKNNRCKGTNIIFTNKNDSYIAVKENTRPGYYNMFLGIKKDALVISSEILPNLKGFKWEELEGGTLIRIINKTPTYHIKKDIRFTPQKSLSLLRFSSQRHLFVPPKFLQVEHFLPPQ